MPTIGNKRQRGATLTKVCCFVSDRCELGLVQNTTKWSKTQGSCYRFKIASMRHGLKKKGSVNGMWEITVRHYKRLHYNC